MGGIWPDISSPIAVVVDSNFAPAGSVDAVSASFATWDAIAAIDVSVSGTGNLIDANAELAGANGANTVTFRFLIGLPDALAVTLLWYADLNGDGALNNNEPIGEADMVFNTKFNWAIDPDGEGSQKADARGPYYDVQNVGSHEVGHVVGLGHTGADDETMYFSAGRKETKKISLEPGDVTRARVLYGAE